MVSDKQHKLEDDIDLRDLLKYLWSKKIIVSALSTIIATFALLLSLTLPNQYTASALLAPAQEEAIQGNQIRAYGGLANLAGINLPSSASNTTVEAIQTILSFKFFENAFLPKIFLPDLMAYKSWDPDLNKNYYRESLYNSSTDVWVKTTSGNLQDIPSSQKSYKTFHDNHFNLIEDAENGLIRIKVTHQSPYIAKFWLDNLIKEVNRTLREDQKNRSLASVNFLNLKISETNLTEIKSGISALLKEETEKLMLIEANEDYAFKVIDPAFVPEEKSGPQRLIFFLVGFFSGVLLGISYLIMRYFWKN